MRHRYDRTNIPTELARSLIAISEYGSFTRAADVLGLSQPAITAQVKRFQAIVGAPLFEKAAGGVALTPLGRMILDQSRALIDANDRILAMTGAARGTPCRIGVATPFAEPFLREIARQEDRPAVHMKFVGSEEVSNGLVEGHFDVGCLFAPDPVVRCVLEWRVEVRWVRSPNLHLDPAAPVPLVVWPSKLTDQIVIRLLDEARRDYSVVVMSPDYVSRFAAVRHGLGVMTVPADLDVAPLVATPERALPAIPLVRAGVCVRAGASSALVAPVVAAMKRAFDPAMGRAGE